MTRLEAKITVMHPRCTLGEAHHLGFVAGRFGEAAPLGEALERARAPCLPAQRAAA